MNLKKIDQKLLKNISILSADKKASCFVFGRNFNETKSLLMLKNVEIENEYLFINSFLCKASQKEIFELSAAVGVDYIFSVASVNSLMYLSKKVLNVDHKNEFGKNVCVAFIDTGLNPHCDFMLGENRITYFKDFVAGKKSIYDDNGHGTFVCGVCSGSGVLSKFKYSGIAPKSQIVALKALNEKGEASANKILDAMEWVYENHKKQNIKVVCMSFGSEPLGVNDPIMLGANALWDEGVIVVAAAGNSGPEYQTIKSPGVSSKIITVGGLDDNRNHLDYFNDKNFAIADFSSRGPAFRKMKPDLVTPSVDIISCGIKKFYTSLSGTSVATPMVAGIACLILEKYPFAQPEKVKKIILESCKSLGFEQNLEGFGLPDFSNIKL